MDLNVASFHLLPAKVILHVYVFAPVNRLIVRAQSNETRVVFMDSNGGTGVVMKLKDQVL
jgi:hypothetical protein